MWNNEAISRAKANFEEAHPKQIQPRAALDYAESKKPSPIQEGIGKMNLLRWAAIIGCIIPLGILFSEFNYRRPSDLAFAVGIGLGPALAIAALLSGRIWSRIKEESEVRSLGLEVKNARLKKELKEIRAEE